MLKLTSTILLLTAVFGRFNFGKITSNINQVKNNKLVKKVVPKKIMGEVDNFDTSLIAEGGKANTLEPTRRLFLFDIADGVEAANTAIDSLDAGMIASKAMVTDVSTSLDTVFQTGKDVVEDVGDISKKTGDHVETIKLSVGNAIKPGSGKDIVKKVKKKVRNPKKLIGEITSIFAKKEEFIFKTVTKIIQQPVTIQKGVVKKMTTGVESVVKAFVQGNKDAEEGATGMTSSVSGMTESFEPTGKLIKVAFEDGAIAAVKIVEAAIDFTKLFPWPVKKALLTHFKKMRDKVKTVVAEIDAVGRLVKKSAQEMSQTMKKSREVSSEITKVQEKFNNLAEKVEITFRFVGANFGSGMKKAIVVVRTSRKGLNLAMNTVTDTIDKFLEATEIIEAWIVELVDAQGLIIRSVENMELGNTIGVRAALEGMSGSFKKLFSSTEKFLNRIENIGKSVAEEVSVDFAKLKATAELTDQKSVVVQELFSVLQVQEYFPEKFDKDMIGKITQLSDGAIKQSLTAGKSVTRFFDKTKRCRSTCNAGFKFNQETCECENSCKVKGHRFNREQHKCSTVCSGQDKWSSAQKICVSKCDEGEYFQPDTQKCAETPLCEQEDYTFDTASRKCMYKPCRGYWYDEQKSCYKKSNCPARKYHFACQDKKCNGKYKKDWLKMQSAKCKESTCTKGLTMTSSQKRCTKRRCSKSRVPKASARKSCFIKKCKLTSQAFANMCKKYRCSKKWTFDQQCVARASTKKCYTYSYEEYKTAKVCDKTMA